jgi:hypothetical protein
VAEWSGSAAVAYRTFAGQREQALRALSQASETMALITEGAGMLIGTVRTMVRDAVATVVSRLAVYAAELIATAGLAAPLVAEQVATLCAAWGARIARWLRGLINSLRKLLQESGRLGQHIEALKTRMTGSPDGGSGNEPQLPLRTPEPERPKFDHPKIDSTKVAGYALNPDHPVGQHKYRVINSATGLTAGDAAAVEQQIREGVRSGTPIRGEADKWGQRWAVDVPLTGPTGTILVRTAWIIDVDSTDPRLVSISFPK